MTFCVIGIAAANYKPCGERKDQTNCPYERQGNGSKSNLNQTSYQNKADEGAKKTIASGAVTVTSQKKHIRDEDEPAMGHDETDRSEREDHYSQFVAQLVVKTDSEITGLQSTQVEEENARMEEILQI
ncbi:unnamed protein product, partial [Iphiclides podalirius]